METNRVKWDESVLVRCFAYFSDARFKAENQVFAKKRETPPEEILELESIFDEPIADEPITDESIVNESIINESDEGSDIWKDFSNDIDWAMM